LFVSVGLWTTITYFRGRKQGREIKEKKGKAKSNCLSFSYLLLYFVLFFIFKKGEEETGIVLRIRTSSDTHSPKVRR
jgi:hypothetical protein